MSITAYGVQFACDLLPCKSVANSPAPSSERVNYLDPPVPAGWTAIGPDLNITVTNLFGAHLQHLCSICSALPISAIAARLRASYPKESNASADNG